MNKAFPFELILKDDKELFINTVEKLLIEDLQSENSFGCRICDCHTHVGSKKHFNEFIEAELLFHNSYYNKGFAFLSVNLIYDKTKDWEKIALIGYETFSELYLCETVELLRQKTGKQVVYCVAETIGSSFKIRTHDKNFFDNNTYYVFIVPINTTLTTHDKLMNVFKKYLADNDINNQIEKCSFNLGLIMLSPKDTNDFWCKCSKTERIVCLKEDKQKVLKNLRDREVYYFAEVNMPWSNASECVQCFPDLKNKTLVEETPIFEVNRASIVPMLQLGPKYIPEPLDVNKKQQEEKNIKKIVKLCDNLYHHHIFRNGNHYQYYFQTQNFFESVKNEADELSLENWLKNEVKRSLHIDNTIQCSNNYKQNKNNYVVYNFLVAPRHHSNAGFVQYVNDIVFDGSARILYFEVGREYRNNVKAKYSDFSRLIDNITSNYQNSIINFHYVDDMIFSGNTFFRTKSLMNSLIRTKKSQNNICKGKIFSSIILLAGRSSNETKKSMIEETDNFFEFTHLSISPMRKHENACTLCQLVKNFEKLERISASNEMAAYCRESAKNHEGLDVSVLKESYKASSEKKLRVIIRHLLNERLKNKWWLDIKSDQIVVMPENSESIYNVLVRFYKHLHNQLNKYDCFSIEDVNMAFIKVITRPFFTYHIRRKQASFRFCIELTEQILNTKVRISNEQCKILQALINGLSDMRAIYLIRSSTMEKILHKIDESNGGLKKELYYKSVKKMTGLSSDDSLGLFLEYVLVKNDESAFLGDGKGSILANIDNSDKIALYLENNQVLISGFREMCEKAPLDVNSDVPYYLEKFKEFFVINNTNVENYFEHYYSLYQELSKDSISLSKVAEGVNSLLPKKTIQVFLRDTSKEILLEKYIYISPAPQSNDIDEDNSIFYSSANLERIDCVLNGEDILDTIYEDKDFFIIKISNNKEEEIFFKLDKDNSGFAYNVESLFGIKVLLTLRNKIIDILKKINISDIKRHLEVERTKKALTIEKAGTHHAAEYFEGQTKIKTMCKMVKNTPDIEQTQYINKIIFDNYLQLLANNFVSELYRRVVVGIKNENQIRKQLLEGSMYGFLCDVGFELNQNDELVYTIIVPNTRGDDIKVRIKCNYKSFNNKSFWYFLRGLEKVKIYYLLILTMAGNAGRHYRGNSNDTCNMKVYADGEYIVFSNNISDTSISPEEVENIREIVRKKMYCPPWEYPKKQQSITLWALSHYFECISRLEKIQKTFPKEEDWICVNVNSSSFEIKLRMLNEVED